MPGKPDSCQTAASSACGRATTRIPGASSTSTVALRVVERGRADDGLAAIDLDAVAEGSPPLPAQKERLPEERGVPAPRHVADDLAIGPDGRPLGRRRPVHREAHPAAFVVELR